MFTPAQHTNFLADVSDIFYVFGSGVGKGRGRPSRWPGGRFFLELEGEGGGLEEVAGAGGGTGAGSMSARGAKYFFSGPKCPPKSHSHFPQKIPPNRQKWGPQNEFPAVTRTKGVCGNPTGTLNFPTHPDLGFWGPHFQRFGGK